MWTCDRLLIGMEINLILLRMKLSARHYSLRVAFLYQTATYTKRYYTSLHPNPRLIHDKFLFLLVACNIQHEMTQIQRAKKKTNDSQLFYFCPFLILILRVSLYILIHVNWIKEPQSLCDSLVKYWRVSSFRHLSCF